MRISQAQQKQLKSSIRATRPNAKVYLFGSRADDQKKGGDIDILVIDIEKLTFEEKSKIRWDFINLFGDQKLDIVSFTDTCDDPFKEVALTSAVSL